MKITRSFRGRLALRFGIITMLLTVTGSGLTYVALHYVLYDRLDALLRRLAEIEASATADSPDESVHFHDAIFLNTNAEEGDVLSRYAQVWTVDGNPEVRTANLAGRDLPLPRDVRERVAATSIPELFAIQWNGKSYRSYLYPLVLVGEQHRQHLLQVAASTDETQQVLNNVLKFLAILVLVGMVGGAGAGWWLAGYAVRPVVEITRQAEAFDVKPQHHRISAQSDTVELNRLVTVLNAMLERIDGALDLQRRFLADAGHSIMTPLTILRGDIDVALRRPRSAEEYEDVLKQSLKDLKDVSILADDLITLARSDGGALNPDLQRVAVTELLSDAAKTFESSARRAGTRIQVHSDSDQFVYADRALLERAVGNILDNAIKYASEGDEIVLSAAHDADGWVRLSVADHGPGVPPEQLDKLFDRFYRGAAGRRQGVGSGLGLPIAKAIIESHEGDIHVWSEPGKGTTVTVRLRQYSPHASSDTTRT